MSDVQDQARRQGKPLVKLLKQGSTATEGELRNGLERFLRGRNAASVDDAAIKVLPVSEDYPREGLDGQAFAQAATDLPRHHILGLYTGFIEEANDRVELDLDAIRHKPRFHYQFTSKAFSNKHGSLIINPLPNAGNKLIAINDDGRSEANVQFVEFLHYDWPTVCMATLRPIKESEELLVDYGPDYWKVHHILEEHVWVPLDKLQQQRVREGHKLLEIVENSKKRTGQTEAKNSELSQQVADLSKQVAELKRKHGEPQNLLEKRSRKRPM
uniref:SET domain-containing protein n=1 Tax=Haptolina ericina TaxID=156174 RepID=A0A7S3BSQ9_9EUKA